MKLREEITRDIAVEYDSEDSFGDEPVVRIVVKDKDNLEVKRPCNLKEMVRWGEIMNIAAAEIAKVKGVNNAHAEGNGPTRVVQGPDGQPVAIPLELAKKMGMVPR